MTLCGLFAALTAICSWISIPLGFTPVPMNLATLAVFLAGGLLGPKYGSLSITVYALAGAVGAPVFAGFRGGLSVLAGPTGGYIIGYIAAALIAGLLCTEAVKSAVTDSNGEGNILKSGIVRTVLALVAALVACYALGTVWFIISTHTNPAAALISCVIPFLPGDAIKIAAGTILLQKLRKYV
ncbi:MAG: biotin transporter BioY [Firmicutes bacterium]|nr:biotin transporter BioY [Bacillota bacterium]